MDSQDVLVIEELLWSSIPPHYSRGGVRGQIIHSIAKSIALIREEIASVLLNKNYLGASESGRQIWGLVKSQPQSDIAIFAVSRNIREALTFRFSMTRGHIELSQIDGSGITPIKQVLYTGSGIYKFIINEQSDTYIWVIAAPGLVSFIHQVEITSIPEVDYMRKHGISKSFLAEQTTEALDRRTSYKDRLVHWMKAPRANLQIIDSAVKLIHSLSEAQAFVEDWRNRIWSGYSIAGFSQKKRTLRSSVWKTGSQHVDRVFVKTNQIWAGSKEMAIALTGYSDAGVDHETYSP